MDLKNSPFTGDYILIRVKCPLSGGGCKQVKLHLISCYEEELVDRNLFIDSDYNDRGILLPNKFTINCAYHMAMLGRDCIT